jgi:glycosyltransferase involved in cell wall biosynthesis
VTLHDLAFLRFPEVLTSAKRLYHRTFTVRSLQQATRIISVSESTKADVQELVGIAGERIQTVYPCIHERFSDVLQEDGIRTLRQQYALTNGYILFLATLEPRKNVTTLIEAYAHLRQTWGVQEKLVLAGGKGWLYESIFARVRELGLEAEVIFPGYVKDDEQVAWYQGASVFAYPSLYEGFGLPVAEALACGTPVVTSNVSSLPEAGAGLALCVDPHDVEALSAALYQALHDQAWRTRCRQEAGAVSQRFSPETMTAGTIAVYEQAAQSRQRRSQRSMFVR